MAIIFLLVVRYVADDRPGHRIFRWMALYPVYNSQQ
jgi:hypothetical protein